MNTVSTVNQYYIRFSKKSCDDNFVSKPVVRLSTCGSLQNCGIITKFYAHAELVKNDILLHLCKCIDCRVFADQHISQLLKHIVLQCKEGLVGNAEPRHQHDHLPVEVQTTCNKRHSFITSWYLRRHYIRQ